jgi:hypothetical protein
MFVITALMIVDFVRVPPPPYIPKSQRNLTRKLVGQWLSWIKPFNDYCSVQHRIWRHRWKYAQMQASSKSHATKASWILMVYAMSAIAISAETGNVANRIVFDTESEPIGIDNRFTATMSHRIDDFISELIPTDKVVKGFAGSRTSNVMKGTIIWKWEDDEGKVHKFIIPNSYYVPKGGVRLLSSPTRAKSQ